VFPKIKKILILRFSSIGDIVLTTPVIRSLKMQFSSVYNEEVELIFLQKITGFTKQNFVFRQKTVPLLVSH
jgi:LEA14-like dessication related protein